jgi:hypothetical protein
MDYTTTATDVGFFAAMAGVMAIISLAVYVLVAIGLWKVFQKAGKPGWAGIVPIYNIYVMTEIVGRPMWFFIAMVAGIVLGMIPILGFLFGLAALVLWFMLVLDLARSFGKDAGFAVGMFFLSFIFIPILGFGDAKYIGPAAQGETKEPAI